MRAFMHAGLYGGGKPAESAEAHRGSIPTAKRTPETGAPRTCRGAEFPEAPGGTMKRHVLRAFEDSRRRTSLRVSGAIKKAVLSHRLAAVFIFLNYTSSRNTASALSPCLGPSLRIRVYPPCLFSYPGAISSKSLLTTSSSNRYSRHCLLA